VRWATRSPSTFQAGKPTLHPVEKKHSASWGIKTINPPGSTTIGIRFEVARPGWTEKILRSSLFPDPEQGICQHRPNPSRPLAKATSVTRNTKQLAVNHDETTPASCGSGNGRIFTVNKSTSEQTDIPIVALHQGRQRTPTRGSRRGWPRIISLYR